MWLFFSLIAGVLLLGMYSDRKHKKKRSKNPSYHHPIHPDAKPGDSSNYTAGDYRENSGL
ncbi:hypothetical protein [Jeotgalibacillus salarius]|uniref:Uncharacterized protein n=1 Tax=Jeotgalibacillus salarius TaxID=546023 RepID=A0A4Y8LIM7_9BACL|nr:hypothetical protein [Jeotgalibacillus salarius]TFE02328.1 hypothetical protein E2626_07050 [Jeotgalibacillus salarius]